MNASHWPHHTEDEINAVKEVLVSGKTNYWTGHHCREFEKQFATFIGTEYAVALMNGTVALEACLYALDINPGDEVITTCRTFIASASCVVMRGAIPIPVDVDLTTQNISPEAIEACITPRTKAIIVVHLAGWPADMESINALAKKHRLKVIEDCAQAHGASIKNKKVGSWGDIAAFSFCQDKIITTGGEGGMITTNDKSLWEKIWSYKDHGKCYDKAHHQKHPPGFRFLHDTFGTNWRMTEIQAVIGKLQLNKITDWLAIRNRNANILTSYFENIAALRVTKPPQTIYHAYYKYYVFLKPPTLRTNSNRDSIMKEINEEGVVCLVGSCSDIQLEQAFKNLYDSYTLKANAQFLGETSLMFLVDPTKTEQAMHHTAQVVSSVIINAMR